LKGVPLVNIESPVRFTKASLTAKFLSPLSTLTALSWPEQLHILDGVVVGPILPKCETKIWDGGYIFVTGGTFGHKKLFDAISNIEYRNVVMQTGRVNPRPYIEKHPNWKIFRYSNNFERYLAGAGVVVTHFGFTVLEAVNFHKPVVIVPNPEWTRTVGLVDARSLAKKVNAVVMSNITPVNIQKSITRAKSKSSYRMQNGAKKLAEMILGI
jgi:UDP-N-acetylglucosamine:LPS N-acetylglucosamine transferase